MIMLYIIIVSRFSRAIKGYTSGRDLDLNKDYYLMFGTGETAQGYSYHAPLSSIIIIGFTYEILSI